MEKNISNNKLTWLLVLVFIAISFFPLFTNLGTQLLRTWDESRYAANSYEMYKSGNYLVTTFDYKPDYMSSKPPFVNWCQVICFKLFGVNEASVRLPSALAVLFFGIVLILFGGKIGKPWLGFYSALIATTCRGIAGYHAGRTGDYDAMLTLFVTTYTLSFLSYLLDKKGKYILFFFIALSLATLTKGIQALIPLPFLLCWLIYKKEFKSVFKSKFTYIGLSIFLLLIGGYYFGREAYDHGYLKAMYDCEIGGRFNGVIDGHKHPFGFYFPIIRYDHFTYFIKFLPFAFIFNFFIKDKKLKELSIFSFLFAAIYLLIISSAQTKLPWYTILALPFMSIIIGISLSEIHSWLSNKKGLVFKILPFIIMIFFFYHPFKALIAQNYKPKEVKEYVPYYNRFDVMKKIERNEIKIDSIVFISQVDDNHFDNNQDVFFYMYKIQVAGKRGVLKEFRFLNKGENVLINEEYTFERLKERFEYKIIYQSLNNKIVNITGVKPENDIKKTNK